MVLFLIAASSPFAWLLTYLNVPGYITRLLLDVSHSRIVVFLLINLILLVLGCVMDMAPLILIMTPILLPVVQDFGMDPVQFGVVLILNLSIGLTTPPVGSSLFVGSAIGGVPIEKVAKSLLPFYASMIVALLLTTFVSSLVLWLPDALGS
jgi:tripartite ATP-independent transporter DctM subunit